MIRQTGLLLAALTSPALGQTQTGLTPTAPAAPEAAASLASAAPTAPASSAAIGVLIRQAQRWLDQGRPELAASSIGRALAAEPRNAEALLVATRIEASRDNREAAQGYAARLRAAGAGAEQIEAAEGELRSSAVDRAALERARGLARENRAEEAATAYRAAFGQREPPSAYAREYFQTLAGTAAGREVARRGLAQLASQPGADARTRLAYAEVLTYAADTRADGIARLTALASQPDTAAEATRAWKRALGFLGNDPAARVLLEEYASRFPGDADIRARLEAARSAPAATPGDDLRRGGFTALDAGALREGARRFEAALALDPNDADALGGLGVVRLRENRAAEARTLLERAVAADPARAPQWRRALDGASYALELAEARTLLRRGDLTAADAVLRRAARRDVEDGTDAESLLGEATLRRGEAVEAEQHFRAALARRPGFSPAVNGLSQALRAQGRVQEASALVPTPARSGPQTASQPSGSTAGDPRASQLRAEASRAADPLVAAALLGNAVSLSPNDPWTRLDLARALRRAGREAEGRALVEELAARNPSPDASYAAALLAQEAGRPADAEDYLARIPAARRTADMTRLASRVRAQAEVSRAAALLPTAPAEGRRRLLLLAARPDPAGATAADAVRALGEAGDAAGALEAARTAEAVNRSAAARLAVAGALLSAGLGAESATLVSRIEEAGLTPAQRREVAQLRSGGAIQAADRLNEAGDQALAFEQLRPALANNPGDPAVELALARLYQGARRPQEAQRIAEAVLLRDPRNPDARRAAAEAAIAAGDRPRAEALAAEARAASPNDSRATLLQARVARGFGEEVRARALLAQAASQRDQELGTRSGATNGGGGANPFATASVASATPGDRVAREIAREIALADDEASPRLAGSAVLRARSGVAGADRLTEIAAPLEGRYTLEGLGGRVTALVSPTLLDAGQTGLGQASALRVGSNAAATGALSRSSPTATGVGLNLAYRRGDTFGIDVGTTPLGFRTSNVVGGIEVAPRLSDALRIRLRAERRPVIDSVLSYAGQRDPGTGITWGGVTQSGGRAALEASIGAGYAYVLGGYATLDGRNVADNARREAGAGFAYPVWRPRDGELTAGVNLVYFGYDNNQRGFTVGQGGYFSPQNYVALNVPVDYRGSFGALRYVVGGTLGYAHFREEASPLFPRNPFLQARAEAAAASNPTIPTRNPGQTSNGVVGGVRLGLTYPLTESLTLSGDLRYDRAADFNETRASMRLENRF